MLISRRRLAELRIGAALLAAGQSRRFGAADKLAQPLGDRLLGLHAADAIPVERLAKAWVIVAREDHPCVAGWTARGFDPVVNPQAGRGMGTSVGLAAELAMAADLDALLIALADMPLVPREHFVALIDPVDNTRAVLVSASATQRMPPALFGRDHFAALGQLGGDQGARDLLGQGRVVACPPEWLIDIDTPEALARLA